MLIPDNETEVDYLNCEAISNTVAELLKDNRKQALTIGIHGDWGAGKSSVLKMVECELEYDKNVACLWFNGWAFEGFDDAKTVLIEAIITEIYRQYSAVGKVKELAPRLLKRVKWLKVAKLGSGLAFNILTGLPTPDQIESVIGGLKSMAANAENFSADDIRFSVEEVSSYLKPKEDGANIPETIHAFRNEFSELLEEANIEQLVVLIDDLDRCLPETAIQTLEAIRLFLFVPKAAFVIGADEAMIEYAVRQHFPDLPIASGPLPYARNYLEKLIQVPFRIPALGMPETRSYVTLLLVQSLVGEDHKGFKALLVKAKEKLRKPWLGSSALALTDVQEVDSEKIDELNAAFNLAQQIGPILAEGTKGNPRQIKRFLNALLVRQVIAKARGFAELINQPVLAKLMLAERFQPDFYDHIAAQAMISDNEGKVIDLSILESVGKSVPLVKKEKGGAKKKITKAEVGPSPELAKWLERDWLQSWLKIDPVLAGKDLRPYVFVARDKRLLTGTAGLSGLDGLIERLCGSKFTMRSAETEVKALSDGDAETIFNRLRERVLAVGNYTNSPPGIDALGIVAKHHARFQLEIVGLLGSLDVNKLGIWVVRGWSEFIADDSAKKELLTLIESWSQQDDNSILKTTAAASLPALRKGTK